MKNKYTTIGIILTTVILAGVAIFTAIKLYQSRNTAVAPNAPSSKPKAAGEACVATTDCTTGEQCVSGICQIVIDDGPAVRACSLSFTISLSTATPTATSTSTATATATSTSTSTSSPTSTSTATATATATPNPQCNNSCTSNSNCPSDLICYIPSGSTTGNCRNAQCLSESDCTCSVASATPTTEPVLPEVGTRWPTILGTGFGILVIIGSLLLAL